MLRLERLSLAIAEQEGWLTSIKKTGTLGSTSYRNHNPGNLRKSPFQVGVLNGFAVFNSDMDGFAALRWDIRQKAIGNTVTGLNGNSTLRELIEVWAPASDGNDPEAYLKAVVRMTGFGEDFTLRELLQ